MVGVQVAAGVACTPATWRTRVWAAPTVLTSSQGARSRGVDVPKALILGGYGFIATNGFGTKCSEYTDAACGAKARQLANSPHRLLNYFQMLVQSLPVALS